MGGLPVPAAATINKKGRQVESVQQRKQSAVLVVATAWPAGAVDALQLAAAAEAAADD